MLNNCRFHGCKYLPSIVRFGSMSSSTATNSLKKTPPQLSHFPYHLPIQVREWWIKTLTPCDRHHYPLYMNRLCYISSLSLVLITRSRKQHAQRNIHIFLNRSTDSFSAFLHTYVHNGNIKFTWLKYAFIHTYRHDGETTTNMDMWTMSFITPGSIQSSTTSLSRKEEWTRRVPPSVYVYLLAATFSSPCPIQIL